MPLRKPARETHDERSFYTTRDRVGRNEFPLTQEYSAVMLGVSRPTVTLAVGALQRAGLIDYGHKRMVILDRAGLEADSCECDAASRNISLACSPDSSRSSAGPFSTSTISYGFGIESRSRVGFPFLEATMTEPGEANPALTKTPQSAADEVLRRVQGEFLEMPGLRLTEAQACRLWGLDAAMCTALLSALIDARFLFRTRDGAFMRTEQATPVKTSLRSLTK